MWKNELAEGKKNANAPTFQAFSQFHQSVEKV